MIESLANILSVSTTTQPTGQSQGDLPPTSGLMAWAVCIGICILIAWIVRRAACKKPLKLQNAPLRANNLGVFHLLGIIFIVLIPILTADLLRDKFENFEYRFITVSSGANGLFLLAAALICGKFAFKQGLIRGMGFSARRWIADSIRAVVAYLASLPVITGVLLLTGFILQSFLPDIIQKHALLEAIEHDTILWKALAFITAVIIAPFAEELFFRGIVQSLVRYNTRSPWQAIFISSFIFAMIHIPYWHTIPALFVLSLVLGYNYERTGRLWAPIMIHMLFNCISMLSELGF